MLQSDRWEERDSVSVIARLSAPQVGVYSHLVPTSDALPFRAVCTFTETFDSLFDVDDPVFTVHRRVLCVIFFDLKWP